MATKNILLLGLPASGKTTFTAALWYYVTQFENNLSLKLTSLAEGDYEYLNSIRDNWVKYEIVPRTPLNNPKGEKIAMNLIDGEGKHPFTLTIPDFSGEIFREQFKSREWSKSHDAVLEGISGLILFVNTSDKKNVPTFIGHANELEAIAEDEDLAPPVANGAIVEWNPDFVPNQVKLVDAITLMKFHKTSLFPLRISIVISSWDRVETIGSFVTPDGWLKQNYPFLAQFLSSNRKYLETAYYGVSAQGGDYSDAIKMDELQQRKYSERIIVKEGMQISNDISKPILWLIK